MPSSDAKIRRARGCVLIAAAIGLAFVVAVVVAASSLGSLSLGTSVVFVVAGGFPFLLALASLALSRLSVQRIVWSVAAVLAALVGLPLIFNGLGFVFLILVVLLQAGKGGMGAAFGGSSQTVFGGSGAGELAASEAAASRWVDGEEFAVPTTFFGAPGSGSINSGEYR